MQTIKKLANQFFFDCLKWLRWSLIVVGVIHAYLWGTVFFGSAEIQYRPNAITDNWTEPSAPTKTRR